MMSAEMTANVDRWTIGNDVGGVGQAIPPVVAAALGGEQVGKPTGESTRATDQVPPDDRSIPAMPVTQRRRTKRQRDLNSHRRKIARDPLFPFNACYAQLFGKKDRQEP